jgi:hypothetical protein
MKELSFERMEEVHGGGFRKFAAVTLSTAACVGGILTLSALAVFGCSALILTI